MVYCKGVPSDLTCPCHTTKGKQVRDQILIRLNSFYLLIDNSKLTCLLITIGLQQFDKTIYEVVIHLFAIQHYVIKFVSDLRQLSGFLQVLRFPLPIILIATIKLKYC